MGPIHWYSSCYFGYHSFSDSRREEVSCDHTIYKVKHINNVDDYSFSTMRVWVPSPKIVIGSPCSAWIIKFETTRPSSGYSRVNGRS